MPFPVWRRIAWCYHLAFLAAVTWPGQTLVNTPDPFVLGLPRQMALVAFLILGSLIVLWRMDGARRRDAFHAANSGDGHIQGPADHDAPADSDGGR